MISENCRRNRMFFQQGGKLVVNSDDISETLDSDARKVFNNGSVKCAPGISCSMIRFHVMLVSSGHIYHA